MQLTVRHLLDTKGHEVWSVKPENTVYEALELMAEKNIGSVLVVQDGALVGILSERDYARDVALKGRTAFDTTVAEIMTSRVLVVSPHRSVNDCMALMTEKRLRHLPVMNGDELVGVISIGDVVRALITEKEFMIEQLETYIMGRTAPV